MGPVQDQGSCGSCVQFAVIGMYESQLMIRGHTYGLSEEANLECVNHYVLRDTNGCDGGYVADGLEILAQVGAVLRENYPYAASSYGDGPGAPTTEGIC